MLRDLFHDKRGGITILSAFLIVGVIGFSALSLEYGNSLLQQLEDQRIADTAAYSGALVFNSTNSTTSANSAVGNIATLNGLSSSAATSSVGNSPTGDGNQAVQVTVSTSAPLLLARVLTTNTSVPVSATAYAEIKANAPGCIIALSGSGTGISLSGTGSLTANNCKIASNTTICANSGENPSDDITTDFLSYGSGANPKTSKCTISSSAKISKATTADPLAGNSEVSGAVSRISTVAGISSPTLSSVSPGTSVTFGSSAVAAANLPPGCTDTYSSSTHTVNCTNSSVNFGSVTLSKSTTTKITGPSGAIYNFSGVIDSGTSNSLILNGSNGTYNMAGGIYSHGTSSLSFNAGTFNIGTQTCSGNTGYSLCLTGSSSMTFSGPSSFTLAGGIYEDASGNPGSPPTALSLGYGSSTNSFSIGKASDTTCPSHSCSLNEANGATLFGDVSGTGNVFQMVGDVVTSGGTCVALPAATEHDINGSINGSGGIVLGSGIYTINGYVALGNGGGGDVSNCPTSGTTTGLTGLNVTLVVSGASTVSCGSLTSSAFCLGAGFSTVKLTAPSSGSTAALAVVGPQSSSNTAGAGFINGASSTQVSGAFYFPNGPIFMSGSATLHDTVDSGACLELIGTQITATAGTALGSTCSGLGNGSTGTTIGLVQ